MSANESFWQWCESVGVVSKQLAIQERSAQEGFLRGLFAAEPLRCGAIVARVPLRACICVHSVPRTLRRSLLSPSIVYRVFRKIGATPYEAQFIWLTAVLASLVTSHPDFFGPYMSILPRSFAEQDKRSEALRTKLDDTQLRELNNIETVCAKSINGLRRLFLLLRRRAEIPSAKVILWAHRIVVSRAILLPEFCAPSAPLSLNDFLDQNPSMRVVPALIPVIDMINCPNTDAVRDSVLEANVALFTCVEDVSCTRFVGSGSLMAKAAVAATPPLRRLAVLCATKDVAAGEELLIDYDLSDDVASLYRYGLLDVV